MPISVSILPRSIRGICQVYLTITSFPKDEPYEHRERLLSRIYTMGLKVIAQLLIAWCSGRSTYVSSEACLISQLAPISRDRPPPYPSSGDPQGWGWSPNLAPKKKHNSIYTALNVFDRNVNNTNVHKMCFFLSALSIASNYIENGIQIFHFYFACSLRIFWAKILRSISCGLMCRQTDRGSSLVK